MFDNILMEILKKEGSAKSGNSCGDETIDKSSMFVSLEFNNTKEEEDKKIDKFKHTYLNNPRYKKFYLINMNFYKVEDEDKLLVKSELKDDETDIIFEVYDINLLNLSNKDCKTFEKGSLEYRLYWVVCNDEEELHKFYEGDELMLKFVDEIAKVTNGLARDCYIESE